MDKTILGIDPGLANTGWGIVESRGGSLSCIAYGCVTTSADDELSARLHKIYQQTCAVIRRYRPSCVGIESVWFGKNVTAAFKTGQARGAALVACAGEGLDVSEFTPREIKMTIVGNGSAEKEQIQYMVKQMLGLDEVPRPDHSSDALAAAICCRIGQRIRGIESKTMSDFAGSRASFAKREEKAFA